MSIQHREQYMCMVLAFTYGSVSAPLKGSHIAKGSDGRHSQGESLP